jgi:glycosyltransferase involved in cell wall biosynthesis
MPKAVHQFHEGILRHDAIGNAMVSLRDLLLSSDLDSEIFVGCRNAEEPNGVPVRLLDEYRGDPANLLLVHHSMRNDCLDRILGLPDQLVLVYHNITPPRFFPGDPLLRRYCEEGREQLVALRGRVVGAVACSQFSARELRRAGFLDVVVVPPVFDFSRFRGPRTVAVPSEADGPLVLSVGRLARNKRQDEIVEVFEALASRYAPSARLALVGPYVAGDPYAASVLEKVSRSPFRERIRVTGSVPDEELVSIFAGASAYLSMSEHEGFGVPLLEAFAAGVPVVAFDAGAVAETMGEGGVLFSRKEPLQVAALLAEVLFDGALGARIREAQNQRLERSDITGAAGRLLEATQRWSRP